MCRLVLGFACEDRLKHFWCEDTGRVGNVNSQLHLLCRHTYAGMCVVFATVACGACVIWLVCGLRGVESVNSQLPPFVLTLMLGRHWCSGPSASVEQSCVAIDGCRGPVRSLWISGACVDSRILSSPPLSSHCLWDITYSGGFGCVSGWLMCVKSVGSSSVCSPHMAVRQLCGVLTCVVSL